MVKNWPKSNLTEVHRLNKQNCSNQVPNTNRHFNRISKMESLNSTRLNKMFPEIRTPVTPSTLIGNVPLSYMGSVMNPASSM